MCSLRWFHGFIVQKLVQGPMNTLEAAGRLSRTSPPDGSTLDKKGNRECVRVRRLLETFALAEVELAITMPCGFPLSTPSLSSPPIRLYLAPTQALGQMALGQLRQQYNEGLPACPAVRSQPLLHVRPVADASVLNLRSSDFPHYSSRGYGCAGLKRPMLRELCDHRLRSCSRSVIEQLPSPQGPGESGTLPAPTCDGCRP